jgi:hypothetical protein
MKRLSLVLVVGCLAFPTLSRAGQETPPTPPPPPDPGPSEPSPAPPAAVPPAVVAQHTPPEQRPPVADKDLPAETEINLDRKTQVAGRLGFEGPLGGAATLRLLHGLGADVRDKDGRVKAVCAAPLAICAHGFELDVAAGTGGGKLSLGLGARAHVDEEDFRGTAGVTLKASLAHTWGSPIGTEPGLTYLGPELDLSVLRVDVTVGVLWRVAGSGGQSALFSWGVGLGL